MSLRPIDQRTALSQSGAGNNARLNAVLQLGVDATDAKEARGRLGALERYNPFRRPGGRAPAPVPPTTSQKILKQFVLLQQRDGPQLRDAWKKDGAFRAKFLPYAGYDFNDFGTTASGFHPHTLNLHFFYDSNVDMGSERMMEFKLVVKISKHVIYEMEWQVSKVDEIDFSQSPSETAYRPLPNHPVYSDLNESLLLEKLEAIVRGGPLAMVRTLKAPIHGTTPQPAGSV